MSVDFDSLPDFLTVAQTAAIIHCDPNTFRAAAWRHPERLGFPVSIIGRRVRVPKEGLRRFMSGENKAEQDLIGQAKEA